MHHLDLDAIHLRIGGHTTRDEGVCLLEAAAWCAGEPHTAAPACVSPVLAAFGRRWNDDLDDEDRQRLRPYIPRLVGTVASPEVESRRAWMAADWMARTYLPAWLSLAGLTEQVAAVGGLDPLASPEGWAAAEMTVRSAEKDAQAAQAATGDAAWDAARAAAWDAAGVATGAAAWAAAQDGAQDAAQAAAQAAAWDGARAAAQAAAWDAAWDAARAAAWDAAWDAARAAARDGAQAAAANAARTALWPTVESLQESAFGLLDAMIACGSEAAA